MRKFFLTLVFTLLSLCGIVAQNALNNAADNIVGVYSSEYKGEAYKVKIVKLTNGTYRGQVIWKAHPNDEKGNKIADVREVK